MNIMIQMMGIFLIMFNQVGLSKESSITTSWRYNSANNYHLELGAERLILPSLDGSNIVETDPKIAKIIFLKELVTTLRSSLKTYELACDIGRSSFPATEISNPIISYPSEIVSQCLSLRKEQGTLLTNAIAILKNSALNHAIISDDFQIMNTIALANRLAQNMLEGKWYGELGLRNGLISNFDAAVGLAVVTGGAQNFGFFRKTVLDGLVPSSESLTEGGFFNEFDLRLSERPCHQLICIQSAVAAYPETKKMYVQLGMNSTISKESFHRKPLNLAVVIDISGSMDNKDSTHQSRLEWAKEATIKTINELNEGDFLSLVTFDTESSIIAPSQRVGDKNTLIQIVKALKTKGTTNLEAGLRDAYQEVSCRIAQSRGFEQRVILITDAGLNTGITDESALLKLVTDFAHEGIGLTALGVGLNFNQKLIDGISTSRGGNYLFVQSGRDLLSFFDAFDFLVTPVAHTLKVAVDLKNIDAKLEGINGVSRKQTPGKTWPLIDVQTLFFSGKQGGAILAEYSLD